MLSRKERVDLFMMRFQGRNDVFARRWEKWGSSVSGYAPVYTDAAKNAHSPFTREWAEKHLLGKAQLGVYPLSRDNTSHWIAADFDGDGWQTSVTKFLIACKTHNLPIAIERSRSGNGAHAWCFFKEAYPAYKSRAIFLALLSKSGVIGAFDKNDSFDRLFPNQDYLSGKGLGNLIALPLQGTARKNNNSVFVEPEQNFTVYDDQWKFLQNVPLITTKNLDILHKELVNTDIKSVALKTTKKSSKRKSPITFIIGSTISIHKEDLFPELVAYLRDELNLLNVEYLVKERVGLSTWGSRRFLNAIKDTGDYILLPRGFLDNVEQWLSEHSVTYTIEDRRVIKEEIVFAMRAELFAYQKRAIAEFIQKDCGILVAPSGGGKTIMGLGLIAQKKQPAIILTHRRQIAEQWVERIEASCGIPKRKIGFIGGTKKKALLPITVAMVQTLARMKDVNDIADKFGTIIVDECHHVPARMFSDVITRFSGRFLFGLTATPERKYNDEKLITTYLGHVIHTVTKEELSEKTADSERNLSRTLEGRDEVIVRKTELVVPFGASLRDFPLLARVISHDSTRNTLIASDVARSAQNGGKCLVLTERKEHAEILRAYFRKDFETILFTGDLSNVARKRALQKITSGQFSIFIATGQILGEGADISGLDTLFLAFPVSFHGKLTQYIGRISREGGAKTVYDYRDIRVPLLEKMWKNRAAHYRKEKFILTEGPGNGEQVFDQKL